MFVRMSLNATIYQSEQTVVDIMANDLQAAQTEPYRLMPYTTCAYFPIP